MLHDRQPEPGAAARARLIAAVEALEQTRQVGGVDALAVVRDRERRPCGGIRQLDRAHASRPRVADRVREQVLDHDAEHPRPQR